MVIRVVQHVVVDERSENKSGKTFRPLRKVFGFETTTS